MEEKALEVMTKQLTIKLNEEKFIPLLKKMGCFLGYPSSNSDLVARCIFFTYLVMTENINGNISFELFCKRLDVTKEEAILEFIKKYKDYVTNGNHKKLIVQKDL
jgi:hypothetical protein